MLRSVYYRTYSVTNTPQYHVEVSLLPYIHNVLVVGYRLLLICVPNPLPSLLSPLCLKPSPISPILSVFQPSPLSSQHLTTFVLDRKEAMINTEDGIRKLRLLDAKGKVKHRTHLWYLLYRSNVFLLV